MCQHKMYGLTSCTYLISLLFLHTQIILQDMELYQKHVVLFGLRNLIPIAIVIDAHDRTKQHKIMV